MSRCATPCAMAPKLAHRAADDDDDMMQLPYWDYIRKAMEVLDGNRIFTGLCNSNPLPIKDQDETGVQSPFDLDEYRVAMKRKGLYRCSGNLFWLNMLSAQVQTPRSRSVVNCAEHYFPDPDAAFTRTVTVLIPGWDLGVLDDPMTARGRLVALSPLEVAHGFISRVASELEPGPLATSIVQLLA